MKIAIIGAGFCGLALAWYCLKHVSQSNATIHLFDQKGIGGGASGIATGLLHPFSGAHAKLNWNGCEGMSATKELLNVASTHSKYPLFDQNLGVFRPSVTAMQELDFKKCAVNYPEMTQWVEKKNSSSYCYPLHSTSGLWIRDGYAINSQNYLNGLWKACQKKGAQLKIQKIYSLSEVDEYDAILIAAGQGSVKFDLNMPLKLVKGQVLELKWPVQFSPIKYPLNSHGYIVMSSNRQSCLLGATFEREFVDDAPNVQIALANILPKIQPIAPELVSSAVVQCYAGVRVTAPNHHPFYQRLSKKYWILTGMGSKGLLYHALFAKKLASSLFTHLNSLD